MAEVTEQIKLPEPWTPSDEELNEIMGDLEFFLEMDEAVLLPLEEGGEADDEE